MDDKKKKYVVPEAEVVDFATEDIILTSLARNDAVAEWDNPSNPENEKWQE